MDNLTVRQVEAVSILGDNAPRPGDLRCSRCKGHYRPHSMTRAWGSKSIYCRSCWGKRWAELCPTTRDLTEESA